MKNRILPYLSIFIFLIVSCSDGNMPTPEKTLAETKEKKNTKPTKPKKKEKKKIISPVKKKVEPAVANTKIKQAGTSSIVEKTPAIIHLSHKIKAYAIQNGYSTKLCFLVDMSLPSGRNRFVVYDLERGAIVSSGLAAHGNCNQKFLSRPKFTNTREGGCTSLGKYKVGEFYNGQYGKSFRLYGLDKSNSNAFKRGVVIHGHSCIPNEEIYPRVLCNSFGCVMVSNDFFDTLSGIIKNSDKSIVLWVYG